jgi:cytochrome c-type biogenesis protein CcmH
MASEPENTTSGGNRFARYALIAAGIIGIGAVGVSVYQGRTKSSGPPVTANGAAGDVEGQIAELESKLKADPNDANGWRMLGWSLFNTQKYAEAASAYAKATQLEPKNAEYWSSLGEARVMAGDGSMPADAKKAFEQALAIDPKDPRARYFNAVAMDMAGDHKGAIDGWFALLADTPAGAPWEEDVKRIITEVAAKEKIDVAARMKALRPASPAPTPGGAAMATAPIPGPTPAQMREASGMPKGQQDAMIQGMVDGLEGKLKTNPDNPQGWIMLMRSRMSLGETAKASTALKSARSAFASDTQKRGIVDAAAKELGVPGA